MANECYASCESADCWYASAASESRVRKDWGKVEALHPNYIRQSDMTKILAGPSVGSGLILTTGNGTQFTSTRYVETLNHGNHAPPHRLQPSRLRGAFEV